VRLGTPSSNEFIQGLNEKNQKIQQLFLKNIEELTKTVPIRVMLGDSSVIDQKTFDPMKVQNFYQKIIKNLRGWIAHDISTTQNEDLRRIFAKFEVREGNYVLSCHMSLQYHVLLYYKPDHKVIDCQKELAKIMDQTKDKEMQMTEIGEQFILEKLKEMGYKNSDHQSLFELFFNNDELREKIYKEIEEKIDMDFQDLKRKNDLFKELDSYLLEIYQTSPVLIDDNRLITGEEGCLCTFDLEFIKNKSKLGLFDPQKISQRVRQGLISRLDEVINVLKN
jgi:hypothetical protein